MTQFPKKGNIRFQIGRETLGDLGPSGLDRSKMLFFVVFWGAGLCDINHPVVQNYVKQNSKSAFASCAAFAASCRSAIVEAAAAATIFTFVKNWEVRG